MSCDIHVILEIENQGKWEASTNKLFGSPGCKTQDPFDFRSYAMFSFLAGVRQVDNVKPIASLRGLPSNSEFLNTKLDEPYEMGYSFGNTGWCETKLDEIKNDIDYHSYTYIMLSELVAFDYEKAATTKETYKEYLPDEYFDDLELLKKNYNPHKTRIVIWFDG